MAYRHGDARQPTQRALPRQHTREYQAAGLPSRLSGVQKVGVISVESWEYRNLVIRVDDVRGIQSSTRAFPMDPRYVSSCANTVGIRLCLPTTPKDRSRMIRLILRRTRNGTSQVLGQICSELGVLSKNGLVSLVC